MLQLAEQSENQLLEFKESWRDEYLRVICGFANSAGGRLIIGKDDSGKAVDLKDSKRLLEDIPNKIKEILGILVEVNLQKQGNKEVIEIVVEPYLFPVSFRGEYYQRVGSTTQTLKGAALNRFLLKRQGLHWDVRILPMLFSEPEWLSYGAGGNRRHYLYVPPLFRRSRDLLAFLKDHQEGLTSFREGLQKNVENRYKCIISVLKQVNEVHLPKLNEEFSNDSACWFAPLTEQELHKIVAFGQPSREHLSELLYERFKKVFLNRVLFFKAQVMSAEKRFHNGIFSQWELDAVHTRYHECRQTYIHLSRSDLAAKYLASRNSVDYDSAFDDELPLLNSLRSLPGKVVFQHPVSIGLKNAIKHVIECSLHHSHRNHESARQRGPESF